MDGEIQCDGIIDCEWKGREEVDVPGCSSSRESLLKMQLDHWGSQMPGMPRKLVRRSIRSVFARGLRDLTGENFTLKDASFRNDKRD